MKRRSTCAPVLAAVGSHAAEAAGLLRALGNAQRLQVLCALLAGPRSVGQINETVPLSQSALSQHLGVLRAARVVATERESQTVRYSLAPGPALEIIAVLHRAYCGGAVRSGARRRVHG
jgi:ArsR family transcriptional regulator, virulence genes transcriptional regulator